MSTNTLLSDYSIIKDTYLIQGIIQNGQHVSLILDKDGFKVVDAKPNILIGRSLKKMNSSLSHTYEISKQQLSTGKKKLPIIVSHFFGKPLVFFPLFSPRCKDNIWVNYNAIYDIIESNQQLTVTFLNGKKVELPIMPQAFYGQLGSAFTLHNKISLQWRNPETFPM